LYSYYGKLPTTLFPIKEELSWSPVPNVVVEIDEMHSYISSKKTFAGYGLLLIDMGKGSSTAYWAIAGQQPGSNCGMPSRISTISYSRFISIVDYSTQGFQLKHERRKIIK